MRTVTIKLSEFAVLTGFLHDKNEEMENIEAFPAVLVLPGGGFRTVSFREGEPIAQAYFAKGYQGFVLKYTTVTDNPNATIETPMQEVVEAIKYLRANAKDLALIANQICLVGFSGGGHLAAAVATHSDIKPDALILGYPGIVHSDLRAMDCPDICESVDKKTPETFMFGMNGDTVTPPEHMLAFANALNKNGIEFEMHMFKGLGHGLSLGTSYTCAGFADDVKPRYAKWFEMSVEWLEEVFGDFKLYGVNDGRDSKYNIDRNLQFLFGNQQAKELCIEKMPVLAGFTNEKQMIEMTPRKINGFMKTISKEELIMLDEELSTIQ